MLNAVIGLFSQDLAVDLGTSNTRVHLRGAGIVCDEPTVMAIHEHPARGRSVVAVGQDAQPMLGRTPRDLQAIQPIRAGRIAHFEVAEAFLLHLMRRVHGRNGWIRPRMVVAVPHQASDMEIRAVRDSCESAGARDVQMILRPVAAALGAHLPINQPAGTLVIDIGGGSTEISLLALSEVVASRVVPGGGEGMDQAIVDWLSEAHGIMVGLPSAERLKEELGLAGGSTEAMVKGRCLTRGTPVARTVSADEVRLALLPKVRALADELGKLLAATAPELTSDVVDHGVVLTGGGSMLSNLESTLRDWTHFPFIKAEAPSHAVINGLGRYLDDPEIQARIHPV